MDELISQATRVVFAPHPRAGNNERQFKCPDCNVTGSDGSIFITLQNALLLLVDTGDAFHQWDRTNITCRPWDHPWFTLTMMSKGQSIGQIKMSEINDTDACGVVHHDRRQGKYDPALLLNIDAVDFLVPAGEQWLVCQG